MLNKPLKFGFKIWTTANLKLKYLHNFLVYTSANWNRKLCGTKADEANINYKVVMHFMQELYGIDHVVVMDNFFTLPYLLVDLLEKETMETDMVSWNLNCLPSILTNAKK